MENRITTNLFIKNAPLCRNCPARIYQKDDSKLKYGQGMLMPDIMFIFPTSILWSEDINNYLEMICKDIIDLNAQYITCHPKCTAGSPVEEYASYCEFYLIHEITKVNPNKIIFFGVDVPEKVITNLAHIYRIYKFNDLYTIKHGSRTVQYFRDQLKQIL